MALLAYNNKNNTLVSRIELSGARYLFNVTVNPSTNKAHFIGQSNEMAQINLRQIYVPIVQTLNASLQPDPPSGLKYIHLIDPNSLDVDDEHYPVLTIEDINYWGKLLVLFIDDYYLNDLLSPLICRQPRWNGYRWI